MPCPLLADAIAARLARADVEPLCRLLLRRAHSIALRLSPPLIPSRRDYRRVRRVYELLEAGECMALVAALEELHAEWSRARLVQGLAYVATGAAILVLGVVKGALLDSLLGFIGLMGLAGFLSNKGVEGC